MKTQADIDNAISFDDLVEKEEQAQQPKHHIWATIGVYTPLIIEEPTPWQDNAPSCLK